MGSPVITTLIIAATVFAVSYGWISYLLNRGPRPRAAAGRSGASDSYSDTGSSGGFWFSSDSSASSADSGSCSAGDSGSGGGDCGGGGDGGGGSGGD
jgi:hypothetical protein